MANDLEFMAYKAGESLSGGLAKPDRVGCCLKMGFEKVWGKVTECGMPPFGVVVGDVVADFQLGFGQAGETAAVEQFGPEPTPKRFGVGVVVTIAAPVHALLNTVFSNQVFETGGRVLAALVGVDDKPGRWGSHHEGQE